MPDSEFNKLIQKQGLRGLEQLFTDFNQVKSLEAPSHSLLVSPDGTVSPALNVDNSGNVGIGTTAPAQLLDVAGNIRANSVFIANGADGGSKTVRFQTDASNRWLVRSSSTAESGSNVGSDFEILRRTDAGGALGTPLFIKRDTGLTGFNTTAPAAQLHVDQSSGVAAIPVLTLNQANLSEEYINFISATTGAGDPIDTVTAVGTTYARGRLAVNGIFKFIQLYNP